MPIIPGHEFTGVVDQLGDGVTGLRAGQKVMAQAAWGCGQCKHCLEGKHNLCTDRRLLGANVNGALAEYIKVPASAVIPLEEDTDLRLAQSIDSLSCSINACGKAVAGDRRRGRAVRHRAQRPAASAGAEKHSHQQAGGGRRQKAVPHGQGSGAGEPIW